MERPKTTYNHLKPSTTIYNHLQPPTTTSKNSTTTYNHLQPPPKIQQPPTTTSKTSTTTRKQSKTIQNPTTCHVHRTWNTRIEQNIHLPLKSYSPWSHVSSDAKKINSSSMLIAMHIDSFKFPEIRSGPRTVIFHHRTKRNWSRRQERERE